MVLFKSYLAHAKGEKKLSPWMCLAPLGWLASLFVRSRNWAFDRGISHSKEPPLPVISVGNVTLGGTNKTPFVEMITRGLSKRGLRPGIVSRGYGGSTEGPHVFRGGKADRNRVGDEPLLLSNRLPGIFVAVSRDRFGDIRALSKRGVQIVVADDGFQHRKLGRDLDVVLVDAACPFGNGRLVPGGILREPVESLRRAHIVVMTKVDQVSPEAVQRLYDRLCRVVPRRKIFRSSLRIERWCLWNGSEFEGVQKPSGRTVVAFSAIGNPRSFLSTLSGQGVEVIEEVRFKDHHRYTSEDLKRIERIYRLSGAFGVACTEKDVYNLPRGWKPPFPLMVPFLETEVEDEDRFWRAVTDGLRPKVVVASNGYGEDAMASLLARKIEEAFPVAEVTGFPLVGKGEQYLQRGIKVGSSPSVTPTGGVIKYRIADLLIDVRSGLFGHIRRQLKAWRKRSGCIRTPLCVGDVYLLLHTLWGQGQSPLLIATAKTNYLHGHWMAERALLRGRARTVWTRDEETAEDLSKAGVSARFQGNPIMDLIGDNEEGDFSWPSEGDRVLILPGSRNRAYEDVRLLLKSVVIVAARRDCRFVAVLAPTLDLRKMALGCPGWTLEGRTLKGPNSVEVHVHRGPVAEVAAGAQVLLGLGGTANQVCAGLGVPVVSILEKGKLVQQKLLGEAEWLVSPDPDRLAEAVLLVLSDETLARTMAEAGRKRLGASGALDSVVRYCSRVLGWSVRCEVYSRLKESLENRGEERSNGYRDRDRQS